MRIKELTGLTEAIEEEFGVSGEPQDSFRVDDRVFINAYEITITAEFANSKERVQAIRKLILTFSYSFTEAKTFIQELTITIPWPIVQDEALEIRRKYMEAGFTVKLEWKTGYIPYHKFIEYDKHRRDQFMEIPQEPVL